MQGTFSDFIVAVEHQTLEHFAFGFAMNNLGLRFDASDDEFSGRLDIKFNAGLLYVKGNFGALAADRSDDWRGKRVNLHL